MKALLFITGLLVGVSIFAYLLSLYNDGREKISGKRGPSPGPRVSVDPKILAGQERLTRAPGSRMCPLCGSELTKYEALYASQVETGSGKKILIHGCRYCYKPDEDPEKKKKSSL